MHMYSYYIKWNLFIRRFVSTMVEREVKRIMVSVPMWHMDMSVKRIQAWE